MALLLICEMGHDRYEAWKVPDGEVTIGRADTVLILPNISVSRHHATLVNRDGTFHILDAGGQNGVLVNDRLTQEQALKTGDIMLLGKYKLEFIADLRDLKGPRLQQVTLLSPYANHRAASPADSTFSLSHEMRKKMQSQDKLKEQAALVGSEGTFRPGGRTLTIGPGGMLPASVFLARSPVAELAWSGGGHVLRKTGLFGTVLVNGQAASDDSPLRPGDRIQVGSTHYTYELVKSP